MLAGLRYAFALTPGALPTSYSEATTAATASFVLADNGAYTAYGRVFDKDDGYRDYATTIVVNSVAPSALLTGTDINEGEESAVAFSFAADPSSVDSAAGFRFSFALSAAELPTTYADAGTEPAASFSFDDNGSYIVYGRIFDKDDAFRDYSATIVVSNVAPSAQFASGGNISEGGDATIGFTSPTDPSPADAAAGVRYALALSLAELPATYSAAFSDSAAAFAPGRQWHVHHLWPRVRQGRRLPRLPDDD